MSEILQNVSAPAMVHAIEANLFEVFSRFNAWAHVEVHNDAEMQWSISDVPFTFFNGIFRAQLVPDEVDAAIETAVSRYRLRGVPMLWWTGPATRPSNLGTYLETHGFKHELEQPGMAIDLQSMNENVATAPGVTIEKVNDLETLKQWRNAFAAGFGFPDSFADACFELMRSMSFDAHLPLYHYIGWLNDEPVAASSLFFGAGVAGIYNLATVPDARRSGIGAMITLAPLREARSRGYRVGILHSSEMAANVYRTLGFQEYCKINHYVWGEESS